MSTGAYGANAYDEGSENGDRFAGAGAPAPAVTGSFGTGFHEDPEDRPWTPVPRPAAATDRRLIPGQYRRSPS